MRFAIFSDIHANLEALEAVLADARENKCTDFVCLGDVVGYNANPHECVARVREMDCPIVKGNHDEQASLVESSRDFNEMAEAAIQWTRDNLSDSSNGATSSTTSTRPRASLISTLLFASSGTLTCRWHLCATTASSVNGSTSCGLIRSKNILSAPAASGNRGTMIGTQHIAFITSRARWSNNAGESTTSPRRRKRSS